MNTKNYEEKLQKIVKEREEFIRHISSKYKIYISLPISNIVPIVMNSPDYKELRNIIQKHLRDMGLEQENNNFYHGVFTVEKLLDDENFLFTDDTIDDLKKIDQINSQEPLNVIIEINYSSKENYLKIQGIKDNKKVYNTKKKKEDFILFSTWILIKLKEENKI